MTFDEFKEELEVVESERTDLSPDIYIGDAAEVAWQAFSRLLVKQGLVVVPNDPIKMLEGENGIQE